MLIAFISTLIFTIHLNADATLSAADTNMILGKGLSHYQQGQYVEAQDVFQSLLKSHPDNSALLFNLGLVHYQLEHYGLAIGLWHKVLDQNPHFTKASRAINFTQKKISIQLSNQTSWSEKIRKWVLIYISWDICLLLIATCGFFFLWSKIKYLANYNLALKRGSDRPMIPTRLIILGIFFVLTMTLTFIKLRDYTSLRAIIISPKASVYVSPSQETASLFELLEGSDIIIQQINNDWAQISDVKGQIGWIQQEHIFHYAGKKPW